MDNIRVMIVDDHPMMREALMTALEDESGIVVVGEATNGIEALERVSELHPHVVMMDLLMPGMGGLEAITEMLKEHSDVRILVVSSLEDEEKILAAVQAGALGYFPKTAPRTYLLEAINKVADGIPYLPAGIAVKLFRGIREMSPSSKTMDVIDEPLTARQEEVFVLMGEGRSDREIAETLHLTEATVRSHVHRILQRLGLESRAQAIALANRGRSEH